VSTFGNPAWLLGAIHQFPVSSRRQHGRPSGCPPSCHLTSGMAEGCSRYALL